MQDARKPASSAADDGMAAGSGEPKADGAAMIQAALSLEVGSRYPYDAPDDWWDTDYPSLLPGDWAHAAARGILADLLDRRGIKHEFKQVDEDVRQEIVASIAAIIRLASAQHGGVANDEIT